ncbi:MAG TPA: Crp/Fnr family transcriptional regulator [Thermodesulfobacteriota bacterium]|nr:Crp/Fnr family transcriptional regulator [Thermodesulfobacteriota bacterium]
MEIIKHIAETPLFNGLPRAQIEKLVSIVVDKTLKRGQTIFSEGDEASGLYVTLSGRVKVFKLSPDGKEQILHIIGPGEPFGEVPMFAGEYFPANAETIEETRILFFPRASFMELIRREPSLAMNMLSILSMRLRQFSSLIEDLSLKEVSGRLAAYLLYLSDRDHSSDKLELDIAKVQLASLLGTIPETLSRILGRMDSQGLIKVKGRRIRLLDRKALEDLAAGGKFLV